jgi:hemoglobin-like flavoprotein
MIDQITGEHHVIFREALLATISDFLDETMSNDEKHKFVKVYNILRNLMMGYDPDD